ncbi:MAG: glutathionylspermidine synthase family protein [Bacteroidota bacterium]
MANHRALSVDKRIIETELLAWATIRKTGFQWFANGENAEYLCGDFVVLHPEELDELLDAASEVYELYLQAAFHIADHQLWSQAGIPEAAIPLIEFSLEHERELHLIGRFDFAGGLEDFPVKLLEFNADTCTLLPETVVLQEAHFEQEAEDLPGEPYNELMGALVQQFENLLNKFPDKTASLLISTMGYEEDVLNARIIVDAAQKAGFEDVQQMALDQVIFSPDEGIFIDLGNEEYKQYDFWYKLVPWDFIVHEEPELLEILENIIRRDLAVVMNPAWTLLLQSKAIMSIMYELFPDHPALLKTTFAAADFPSGKYIRKPIFGRLGENISFHSGDGKAPYETEGDYGDFPSIYQELAMLNTDLEGHRYQPSIFWAGDPVALCFRRQDDLIIDDDAEFVAHVVEDDGEVAYDD